MRFINAEVALYGDEDEATHRPGPEENWQESIAVHWFDRERGIGGFQRIGLEPNKREGGGAVLWSFVFTTAGARYRRLTTSPIAPDAWTSGRYEAAGTHAFWFDDVLRLAIRDEGMQVELAFPRFTGLFGLPNKNSNSLARRYASEHFEAAGHVVGKAMIGDTELLIDGLHYRDHSWGPREWSGGMLSHRWITGTFGKEMSFMFINWHAPDGLLTRHGIIIEGDTATYTDNVDVVVLLEADGLTHRGANVVATLPDGRVFDIKMTSFAGAVFTRGSLACVDMLQEARCGERIGYCIAEISNNARNGEGPITLALRATMVDGLALPPAD